MALSLATDWEDRYAATTDRIGAETTQTTTQEPQDDAQIETSMETETDTETTD